MGFVLLAGSASPASVGTLLGVAVFAPAGVAKVTNLLGVRIGVFGSTDVTDRRELPELVLGVGGVPAGNASRTAATMFSP